LEYVCSSDISARALDVAIAAFIQELTVKGWLSIVQVLEDMFGATKDVGDSF
jgi:hypothetical protein